MQKIWFLLFFSVLAFSQSKNNACSTLSKINKLIQEKHYRPKTIDDSLSVYIFNTFLEKLDDNNSLFLASDITELKKHQYKIDNYIKEENCNFLSIIFSSYSKAVTRHQKLITSIIQESISLSSTETIQFSKKRFPYYSQEANLKKLFRKRILLDILSDVSMVSQNKDSILKVFPELAIASKIKILENYDCEAKNKTLSEEAFTSLFLNTFCSYFDPHTMYFSKEEKSNFLSGLSSSNYSFGIDMTLNDKNELEIATIIPNGAAYYSNKIDVGDVLQKINCNGTDYSVKCNNYEAIDKILTANETKKALFTFRKNTGEIYAVELSKQLMRDTQNSVYSYIIEYEGIKTGYIKIPSFYSKFENGKTNVSDDVKKEIVKLTDNKINRLLIDLENNSGGSMQEAINLCGLFINAPAIAQVKYANVPPYLMAPENAKPIFTGKIVVLINGFSASASEFFANAMQDFSMALLVGSQSFGKASIQEIFKIDNEKEDFIKITIGSFYRITGQSNQYFGIKPTITIPSIFEDQLPREKKSKTALRNQSMQGYIGPNSYPLSESQKEVIQNYNLQTQKNQTLQKIVSLKKRFNKLYDDAIAPVKLNIASVFDFVNKNKSLYKDIGDYLKTENELQIYNSYHNFDNKDKSDSVLTSYKIGIKNIKSNTTIFEAVKIIGKLR